jgi:L-alanine-DL-glutamate epimerase-like enolase superfamily enzyme
MPRGRPAFIPGPIPELMGRRKTTAHRGAQAALCHAHGVELLPHQTQPTIGHAANMHLMATVPYAPGGRDAPCQAGRGGGQSTRLDALFKDAPKPQNGAFPVPSGPGLGLDLEKLEPRIKPP